MIISGLRRASHLAQQTRLRPHTSSSVVEALADQAPRVEKNDAIVKINVGGKDFTTLRSTISLSPTLDAAVTASEVNPALTQGGAVFIDRDPKVFHLVLMHLRNKKANLTWPSKLKRAGVTETTVELEDKSWYELRDLFVEAQYYQLPSLVEQTHRTTFTLGVWRRLSIGSPVEAFRNVKVVAAVIGGTFGLSTLMGTRNEGVSSDDEGHPIWRQFFPNLLSSILDPNK
ncbi:hypothetical protein CYMTET_55721 [Cymbomonas tetramitiformis]|uniref:BTB domain-containing protein n=1 Tax=Cymbomonas tetramitiformis TaxID=36881 RepID=A0AAE0EMI7_9CHLO|nr:hypothetical protein CYMTET_55721 [Cymbomonas tetramitiformis]